MMQSFTTQSHQRNYKGNVVVENQNPARGQTKRRKVLSGIATSVMALAIATTGTLLGATTLHNRQLKNDIHALQVQAAEAAQNYENMESMEFAEHMENTDYQIMEHIERAEDTDLAVNTEFDNQFFYPTMTLEARPEDISNQPQTATNADQVQPAEHDNEELAPHHEKRRRRPHGEKRSLRRVPISDRQHEAQPLPAVDNQRHVSHNHN